MVLAIGFLLLVSLIASATFGIGRTPFPIDFTIVVMAI
jgi:hypothetical protein